MKTLLKSVLSILVIIVIGFVAMASFSPAGHAKSPAVPPKIYCVHGGDTLWSIVHDHHEYKNRNPQDVIWDIKKINHMDTSVISSGQLIKLP